MKSRFVVAAAMLASMAIGAAAVEGLHAEAKPPVYFVGEIEVTNPEGYAKEYVPKAREIIKEHGGQLVAAGGAAGSGNPVVAIDGAPPSRVVISRYPSIDAVHAWRNDPAYEKVRKVGEKYAKYRTFAVVGVSQ
jgi:uncharacterized protein (DUF1330 family)